MRIDFNFRLDLSTRLLSWLNLHSKAQMSAFSELQDSVDTLTAAIATELTTRASDAVEISSLQTDLASAKADLAAALAAVNDSADLIALKAKVDSLIGLLAPTAPAAPAPAQAA
jgi:hypothetical protein